MQKKDSQTPYDPQREAPIRKIAQCHLSPGWSTTRQAELFSQYGILTTEAWDSLTIEQLKTMAAEADILP